MSLLLSIFPSFLSHNLLACAICYREPRDTSGHIVHWSVVPGDLRMSSIRRMDGRYSIVFARMLHVTFLL
jgi:hypothetical protein